MRVKMISGICGVALMLMSGVTLAQTSGVDASGGVQTPAPRPPNFPILFPLPTNNNGYADWVQAGDLVQNSPKVAALSNDAEITLAMKRRLLADPDVQRALQLVREGVQKPVFSPRTFSPRTLSEEVGVPELHSLICLVQLLRVEQYVAFADGRVDKAIETLRVELAFGNLIQINGIGEGMWGAALNKGSLIEFSKHIDQLSAYHCAEVLRLVADFLGSESPAVHIIAQLKASALNLLEARRSDTQGLLALIQKLDEESVAPTQAYLTHHPGDINAVLDEAESRVNTMYSQVLLNMSLPIAQRQPLFDDKSTSPGAVLFRAMTMDPQGFLDRYTREEAQLRLLGVHALIHQYRWDHNKLPGSLAELRADNLVKDSFSGIEIVYTQEGDHYTLTTLGVPEQPQ